VARVVAQITRHFDWQEAFGCTFPAVVQKGIVYSAANVDKSWVNVNGKRMFEQSTGRPVRLINDGDAAGIAEMSFGAGRGRNDVVMMLAFGTGIGTAIFTNGQLLPNTELGHLEIRGKDAEWRASSYAMERKNLSWGKWAKRVNEYLAQLEKLFSPDLFIIGGGISKKHEKFFPLLQARAEIVPAQFLNQAGIIGAAMAARELLETP
jgi:polyphosphate glucokinase